MRVRESTSDASARALPVLRFPFPVSSYLTLLKYRSISLSVSSTSIVSSSAIFS